ncbi:hypothetical protein [Nocardia fusca]|uniref:Uncharacterized protein n=1 Tax=Nocardia fusca TaxID=941183 RepID=A0ABV3FIG1_9NOCA
MPGPDGNAGIEEDEKNSRSGLSKGEDEMSADLSTVKRSIRVLF